MSGQINIFEGTDPNAPPTEETADTFTAGFVWQTPTFANMSGATVTLDYFDIEIEDYIDEFRAQEVLDGCHTFGDLEECAKIRRINGTTTTAGAGVELLTTNLDFIRTEGIDLGIDTDWDLGEMGELSVGVLATYLLTQETLSSTKPASEVIDCQGAFGNDCQPTPELRFNQRTTWRKGPFTASLLWRYFGEVDIQEGQRAATFDAFESIGDVHYFDLTGSYDVNDTVSLSVNVRNVTDEDPPIVGNQAGDTERNFGNTFPSAYNTLGRIYTFGLKATF